MNWAGIVLGVVLVAEQPTQQQIAACSGDAFRFCYTKLGNHEALRACMIDHKARLSQGCRDAFREVDVGQAKN